MRPFHASHRAAPAQVSRAASLAALLTCSLVAITVGRSAAETVTLNCDRDTTIYESDSAILSNGQGTTLWAGRTTRARNSLRRGLVRFDVAGSIPAGATILSARLTMADAGHLTAGPREVTLHRVLASWGEGTSNAVSSDGAPATAGDATWFHRFYPTPLWAAVGGDFVSAPSATQSVTAFSFNTWGSTAELVADAQAWLDTPSANHGWLLRGDEATSGSGVSFATRENANPPGPRLTIEYATPTPASPATWGRIKSTYR
jgi:hypothetical protein